MWMPFHLHPEYPPEGIPRAELVARYGDHFSGGVAAMASDAGLSFAPHPEWVPNSRRALELSEWARSLGEDHHERLHERLMDAYWVESKDVTGWDVLSSCVADVGLDPELGRMEVESGGWAQAVDAATAWAHQRGINAVPAFIFDGRLLVSGAHPVETMAVALEQVREVAEPD
jgi:predicted DsbA family dithiol-disulfide isomerase